MKYATLVVTAAAVAILAEATRAGTLDYVEAQRFVVCGVNGSLPGFSFQDEASQWSGIDVDICRAIAAAVHGDPDSVKYVPLTASERFKALREGEIDVLSRNTTWTLARDVTDLVEFAAVSYYDGQAFMVRADLGVTSVGELGGAAVCVTRGTTSEENLTDYFETHDMAFAPAVFDVWLEAMNAYQRGECDAFTADQSALIAQRSQMIDRDAHLVLPKVISKEPLGPVVRQPGLEGEEDSRWLEVVRWTLYAMLEAEERGITSNNVDDVRANSKNPTIRRLLGVEGDIGEALGLRNDWAYDIIKDVVNYAEVFERNLGPLEIERGLNNLWNAGGLHYAMPIGAR